MWRPSERWRSGWDGEFEAPLLQRRVCQPSVPREIRVAPEHIAGPGSKLGGRRTLPSRVSGAKRPRPVTEIRAQPPARPRRISFNDRRALEMLPARIAELQTQITGLNAVLADPDLYARDPGRFVATSQALAIARDELAAAEEQWLTLEMLREQIDDDERKS